MRLYGRRVIWFRRVMLTRDYWRSILVTAREVQADLERGEPRRDALLRANDRHLERTATAAERSRWARWRR